jgi:hydroxymethylbilane synthase
MPHLRLGTRQSALALAQAQWVTDHLQKSHPALTVERILITTSGDERKSNEPPKNPGGLKALFTKEIEEALLNKRIDLAVHSLKDMTADLPAGLILAAVPEREDPRDAWVSKRGVRFVDLPKGAKVATGAVRRQAQLRHHRPDLDLVPLRGNVDTRLRKLEEENFDGIVLALAGLKRLGRESAATEKLTGEVMLPAIGQGALGIEVRADDAATRKLISAIDHQASHQAALAERAFLRALGGSCQTPIAGFAHVAADRLVLEGLVVAPSGKPYLRAGAEGPITEAEMIGKRLAQMLLAQGADKILS